MLSIAITGVGVVVSSATKLTELPEGPRAGSWLVGVDGFLDFSAHLDPLQIQGFDRSSALAVVASRLALEDASGPPCAPPLLGVCLGNTYGCLGPQIALDRVILTEGPQAVSGSLFPYGAFNAAAANVAVVLHARGPNFTLATGAVAGTDACAEAARQIHQGSVVAMLAGGVEAVGAPVRSWLEKLAPEVSPAEGAAVLLLESQDAAIGRGARIHGLIAGASSCVVDDQSRASLELAAASCARSALEESEVVARDVCMLVGEVGLLAAVFGERSVPTCSADAIFGETLSAAGAFQVVLAILYLRHQTKRGPVLCIARSREGVVSALVLKP